ncbi:MAG: site-specific integrase [Treponema sp.]|nr:site-specific integrase [Treponema sp.]
MRQFYLYKNQSGYFNAVLVDPVTGKKGKDKSTHTKDKIQAAVIASGWVEHGVPEARPNSRGYALDSSAQRLNLKYICERVNETEAMELVNLLCKKYGLLIPSSVVAEPVVAVPKKKIVVVRKKNVENVAPVAVPAPAPATVPKPKKEGIPLSAFLLNFWDFEKSVFIKRYMAHGHNMTKSHTDNMLSLVRNYWQPYFGDEITVQELDRTTLDDFFFYLNTEKGLKGGTVNKAINCGSRALRYLFENKKIDSNPMAGIERFNPDEAERGIPTESEVRQLLNAEWPNEAYFLAFKLGAFCGLRAGEISGLRVCDLDLDADLIHVRHSWNDVDGLKCPKNSDVRDLPIDHQTLLQLTSLAKENPNYSDLSYVFFSPVKPEQPYWPSYYVDGLYEALEKIGVSEEQRKERKIVFHSLRHFCATQLSMKTDLKTVQAVMGHRTEAMSKHYSDHETEKKLQNMRSIMQVTWKDIMTA